MLSSLSSSVDDAASFVRTLMIPFPVLVLQMLHYHQPSELLAWTVDHRGLSEDIKVLAILKILCGLQMTVIDLLLCSVSQKPAMINWRKGFFRSSALARFLNVLESDEQGAIHLQNVLRPRAIELVTREIDVEMEDAKLIFHMSTKDITPEYLLSFDIEHGLTVPLKETTPWLRQILMSAMRTTRAVKENKHQNVETRALAPPKVQSGTTAIIYPLCNATLADLRLQPILDNRLKCDMITFSDNVRPTRTHMHDMTDHLVIDIIKILIDNHPGFNYLSNSSVLKHRSYHPPPLGYKTQEYVLRTTTTDESTTDGNIKVARNAYIDQLAFDIHDLNN
ncbi:hypothetical protein P692DRAFT_20882865 [Suillus brevipes Sb2]|nr:hypothetical protein P692DRAFT_20882865 [Suillus brevipes Sb2]